jgi:hypothetical protein
MNNQIITLCLVYTLGMIYLYATILTPLLSHRSAITDMIKDAHASCYINCSDDNQIAKKLVAGRGRNYDITEITTSDGAEYKTSETCLLTFWGFTHFIFYAILGVIAPDMFWQTFMVGTAFEVAEYYSYDCADPLDLIWNSAGFIVGQKLSGYFKNSQN